MASFAREPFHDPSRFQTFDMTSLTANAASKSVRSIFVLLHRWLGLLAAGFLLVTGLTGAVISWDHELDALLNPQLHAARARGPALPSLELARQVEARHAEVFVRSIPLAPQAGESIAFGVAPRVDPATGKLFEPGFNQVFVDPASGEELGKRQWGAAWPISTENFVSFLYKLHYSLHLPEIAGIDRWGIWLLGVIAIGWTVDCFVGFYLTLPARRNKGAGGELAGDAAPPATRGFGQRWKPAWRVRWRGGRYPLNHDLHRAFGLWTWLLLFIVAFTAFSLNLRREVFFPAMALVSQVTPSPFDRRKPTAKHEPAMPRLDFAAIIEPARAEAGRRGWSEPAGSAFYSPNFGIYGVQFHRPQDAHGAAGGGHKRLYHDGQDGRYLGDRQPWNGTAGDLFVQAQFPLHSGRILGLPGRILISAMGLIVAMLSATGVYVWWRKRGARSRSAARKRNSASLATAASR